MFLNLVRSPVKYLIQMATKRVVMKNRLDKKVLILPVLGKGNQMSPRLANKYIGLRMFLIKILLLLLRKESLCLKFKNDLLATPLLFLVVTFD